MEFDEVRIGELLDEITENEKVDDDSDYRLAGVRWWGHGTFIREEKKGREIKGKYLNRITQGWLIYNRLFAFRGSFAVVPEVHTGCYVSNEFPTYTAQADVKEPALTIDYIVYALNSPQYLEMVEAQSTGSTKQSRNRFGQALFEEFVIKVPRATKDLKAIGKVLALAHQLRDEQIALAELGKELRDGVSLMLPMPE